MSEDSTLVFRDILQEFVFIRTYSRWLDDEQRRETWGETVSRYCNYMKQAHGDKITDKEIKEVYNAIYSLEVMPSMRAMWSAGKAADSENLALYNCSFVAIENIKDFADILYVLLCGTGVGFSVERKFINSLPVIQPKNSQEPKELIIFEDSKVGWAKGFEKALNCMWNGIEFECDYSKIRLRGARLKTSGGRASGPDPLKDLIDFTSEIIEQNRDYRLQAIDVHDICCKIADAVVVGGVRRCLPYSAIVFTKNGPTKIKDILIGDEVEVGGKVYSVTNKINSGKQKVLRIKHAFGELKCTGNHRIAVFDDNSIEIIFKDAKDIILGDCLVWDSVGYSGCKTTLPPFLEKLHFNSKKIIIPEIDTDIAWLIGLIHGNGCVCEKSIEIEMPLNERGVLDYANGVFSKFGLGGKISDGHGASFRLRINSAPLARWFFKYIKQSHVTIQIPGFITNAEKDIRRAYLAGVFDSDGRSRVDGVCDQVTTIYQSFGEEIIILLAGLGIGCSKYLGSAEKRRDCGVDAKDFMTISITGVINRQRWINEIVYYTKSTKANKVSAKIGAPLDFKYKASMLGNPQGWKRDKYITLASAIDHGFVEDVVYYPTVIESVEEEIDEVETYDIEVQGAEVFVSQGVIVHNSALLSLSDLTDNQMALAKTGEFWNIHPQRQMSNNSVAYTRKPDVISFMNEWKNLIKSNSGERGIFNRVAAQKKASENNRRDGSTIVGINPCFVGETVVAVADGRNGIDIEQLAKESNGEIKFPVYCAKEITFNNQFRKTNNFSHWKTEIKNAVAFKSGIKEIIEVLLSDGSIFKCTPNHLIATKDGRWVEAQYCEGEILSKFYTTSNKNSQKNYRTINSITNAYNRQYRMIWEFNNGVYDGKVFNVDHVDEKANNDSLNNLRLISVGEHTTKSQNSKMGNNNPIFRMDADYRRWINRKRNINANAMKHDWPEDQRQAAMEKFLRDNPKPEIEDKNVYLNEQITVEEIIWSGETVDVYDLKVEDNSNFYIITKTDDENFMNCSGVLVHNCAEILLRNRELCNLTEVVVRPEDDFTSLKRKIKVATMMGTWQAAFTNFKFVSKKWKQNCDEEALLGVSLSGLRDHKILGCANDEAKKWLGDLKHIAIATNKKIAERIGINRAAAITCVKPSGTVSVLVDCSPGAHVRQTSTGYYVRRVRISATDPLYLMLKDQGIKMPSETGQTPESASTFVLEFPSKAPDGARTRAGQTAEEQLEYWKMLREFYTEHNPSITISVMESEWLDTAAWVYKHFDNIGGLSFLPTSDYVYQLAPYEDIDKDTYERMVTEMKKVDFSKLSEYEKFDQTVGSKEYACSGGSCELR